MAVRCGNTNRGCSRARRLHERSFTHRLLIAEHPAVVAAALGTREIYFSRERDFKAVFRGHRLPRQTTRLNPCHRVDNVLDACVLPRDAHMREAVRIDVV